MKNLIKNIAQEIADEKGLLLINAITKSSNKKPSFEIFIDSKVGVNADVCAEFSREVKARLESTEVGDLDYRLVVSSPGTDVPIKFIDQYVKHINREFKLSYNDGEDVLSIEAKLIGISGEELIFSYKKEELKINYNNIKKAIVKISF
jgi:ribosome maturation factor RimP